MEAGDGLIGLAQVLIAATDVAQVDRVKRLGVQLREQVQRFLVPLRRERLARLELPRIRRDGAPGREQRQHPGDDQRQPSSRSK